MKKRRVLIGIALLVFVTILLTFCKLNFDLAVPDPTLNITAQAIYQSASEIIIQFSYSAEEDKHLCRYSLAKNESSAFTVILEREEELIAGQVYERTFSSLVDESQYRFSFSVLVERNGIYETPPFLQDSIDFWVDSTPPSDSISISVPGGYYNIAKTVFLDHPEIDPIKGLPARLFYTTDGSDPGLDSTLYIPDEPVPITSNTTLKAVAIDLADRPSAISSATYIIDIIPPIAPNRPTSTAAPYINEDEYEGGVEIEVALGNSGAEIGDKLELLIDDDSFENPLTRELSDADITAGYYTFTVEPGQLGADGTKKLTARVTDKADNPGSVSDALTLIVDATDPEPPSASLDSGIHSIKEVILSHPELLTSTDGTPVTVYYTLGGTTPDVPYDGLPIGLPEGPTELKSVAIDEAGNSSSVMTASYMIDTIPPVEPTTNPIWKEPRGESSEGFFLYFEHDEIPQTSPTATTVSIFFSKDPENPPDPNILYDEEDPPWISANTIVNVVAIDQTGNRSGVVTLPYTFIKIDDIEPPSCPINSSMSFFDLSGFFGIFFKSGVYEIGNADVFVSQGSSTPVKCAVVNISSTERHLIIGIDGEKLMDNGMIPGEATITVRNPTNGDSDSASFLLE